MASPPGRETVAATHVGGRMAVDRRLTAQTSQGVDFVRRCERLASRFEPRATDLDREGRFGFENWDGLKASGVLRACVPAELGGLGVESIHDVAVGISRLARGDASMAIGANMHLSPAWGFARRWRAARARSDAEAEARCAAALQVFGAAVFAGPNTEPGNDVSMRPATTATPVDDGYLINGTKIFGTNTPVADLFGFWVSIPDRDGGPPRMATAMVPKGAAGMTTHDDWDALGMRASGSCSVSFVDCFVPAVMVSEIGVTGQWSPDLFLPAFGVTFPLIATFIGIAEAAIDTARHELRSKRKGPSNTLLAERPGVQQLVAEAEVHLSAARAALARSAMLIDGYYDTHHPDETDEADLHQLMLDFQCTNLIVKQAAVAVVDRAMNAVGGGSYMNRSPLARHWRDVRAGSFMQPFSPVEAYGYIGSVSLGGRPTLDS